MGLIVKCLTVLLTMSTAVMTHAFENDTYEDQYLQLKSMEVREIQTDAIGFESYDVVDNKNLLIPGAPNSYGQVQPSSTERAAKVISVAKDLVALGEDLYRLVIKGKPSNKTTYAPISIVPRINGEYVDILDTETWKAPIKRTFEVIYTNKFNMDVVTFRYSVIYSYGGSYNGAGAYLTAVQIIPESVRTLFGFDFSATMKLGGLQNQGTRVDPVAAATLLMEYTVSSLVVASNETASFFITGKGSFKKF